MYFPNVICIHSPKFELERVCGYPQARMKWEQGRWVTGNVIKEIHTGQ